MDLDKRQNSRTQRRGIGDSTLGRKEGGGLLETPCSPGFQPIEPSDSWWPLRAQADETNDPRRL